MQHGDCEPTLLGETKVGVGGRSWPAANIGMGNPHAVAFVDSLDDAGALTESPVHDPATYPEGVNVEFVVRRGERHVAMRVHERGSGETRSCGTGACAVMVASALADGAGRGTTYRVDVPGGRLADRHVGFHAQLGAAHGDVLELAGIGLPVDDQRDVFLARQDEAQRSPALEIPQMLRSNLGRHHHITPYRATPARLHPRSDRLTIR